MLTLCVPLWGIPKQAKPKILVSLPIQAVENSSVLPPSFEHTSIIVTLPTHFCRHLPTYFSPQKDLNFLRPWSYSSLCYCAELVVGSKKILLRIE